MRDELELQRQEMFRDSQYYQDRYTEITGRLERLSTHLYRQFGVSVESWERSGYPRLTPRAPTLTMRPTGSTAGRGGLLFGAPARGSDTPTTDMLSSGMASLGTISTPRSAPRYAFGGPAYAAGSASMSGLFQPTFGPVATVRRGDSQVRVLILRIPTRIPDCCEHINLVARWVSLLKKRGTLGLMLKRNDHGLKTGCHLQTRRLDLPALPTDHNELVVVGTLRKSGLPKCSQYKPGITDVDRLSLPRNYLTPRK